MSNRSSALTEYLFEDDEKDSSTFKTDLVLHFLKEHILNLCEYGDFRIEIGVWVISSDTAGTTVDEGPLDARAFHCYRSDLNKMVYDYAVEIFQKELYTLDEVLLLIR